MRSRVRYFALAWAIVLSFAVALAVLLLALNRGQQETQSARELATAIQQSRLDGIRAGCLETNSRYDLSIKILDTTIRDLPPGSRRRTDAVAHRALTLPLLTTVTPKRDCAEVVQRARVGS